MKSFITIIVFILIAYTGSSKSDSIKEAKIQGKMISGNLKKVQFKNINENRIVPDSKNYTAIIQEDSSFTINIPVKEFATGKIVTGAYVHDICFYPGDEFSIFINADTVTYTGNGANKNNYLYQAEINNFSNSEYYKFEHDTKQNPIEIAKPLKEFHDNRLRFFREYCKSHKIQKEFIEFYTNETKIIYEYVLLRHHTFYSYYHKQTKDSILESDELLKLTQFHEIQDDSKCISPEYLESIREVLLFRTDKIIKTDSSQIFEDIFNSFIIDSLSGKTQEYFLAYKISKDIRLWKKYDSLLINFFQNSETSLLSTEIVNSALDEYHRKQDYINHPLPPEITYNTILINSKEKEISFEKLLSKNKGKVIYIDFWHLYCSPCLTAMKYSKILKNKLEKLPIEFVYISTINYKNDQWERLKKITQSSKNNFLLKDEKNAKILTAFDISFSPCYMIFDKKGNLIDFNADRPTKEVETEVTELEKTLRHLANE